MTNERALSVVEAMTLAKGALESVRVRVVGEVSEFNDKSGYKAAYFTIADDGACMPCLMWRDAYIASGVTLQQGALVELTGQFSAYVPKGRMQFTVRSLSLAGEGRLRLRVAELARRLESEGLMRPERKRALPAFPSRIAVVTSPRGKAVHDVLRTLRRRYPLAEVLVAGVAVEGDAAPDAIAQGLSLAVEAAPDVILLVRGGGSYEDLMPFNSETVARAVASCPVPIVSGIGHEPDTSIADMVADLRASTPTAAAEAVAPSLDEVRARLRQDGRSMARSLQFATASIAHRVTRLAERPVLSDPHALFSGVSQTLDMARIRLERALPERLARDTTRVQAASARLALAGPVVVERAGSRVGVMAGRLEGLSPLKVLARGYSATFLGDGRTVLSSVAQVSVGDAIRVRVADGHLACEVEHIEREEL